MERSSRRALRATRCSRLMLLLGGRALRSVALTSRRTRSAAPGSSLFTAVSTVATISEAGTRSGATAKLRPFPNKDSSVADRVLEERLRTHLAVSTDDSERWLEERRACPSTKSWNLAS